MIIEKYISKKYDTTIIEIKPEKDKINYFLELDEEIFQENLSKESIYILQYPKNLNEQKAAVSYGILNQIYNYDLIHYCCTEPGSSGSPILKLSNNKVIGIHKEGSKFDYNKGTFLKEPIIEYINNYKNSNKFDYELNNKNDRNKNNEIRIKLKIDKKDINKRIYLLCNCPIDSNISEYNILIN